MQRWIGIGKLNKSSVRVLDNGAKEIIFHTKTFRGKTLEIPLYFARSRIDTLLGGNEENIFDRWVFVTGEIVMKPKRNDILGILVASLETWDLERIEKYRNVTDTDKLIYITEGVDEDEFE